MAMTFLGENRTGAEEQEHLHEAPWIMTGPLVVLGVLSAVGRRCSTCRRFVGGDALAGALARAGPRAARTTFVPLAHAARQHRVRC